MPCDNQSCVVYAIVSLTSSYSMIILASKVVIRVMNSKSHWLLSEVKTSSLNANRSGRIKSLFWASPKIAIGQCEPRELLFCCRDLGYERKSSFVLYDQLGPETAPSLVVDNHNKLLTYIGKSSFGKPHDHQEVTHWMGRPCYMPDLRLVQGLRTWLQDWQVAVGSLMWYSVWFCSIWS